MKSLMSKYKHLRLREIEIKREVNRSKKMPKLEVLVWLDAVDNVKEQVKQLEKTLAFKITTCLARNGFGYSSLVQKLSKEVDQLCESSKFSGGVYVQLRVLGEQCPSRSELVSTIWDNLMDQNVGITGIYGGWGLGKTTAVMSMRKKLAKSDVFDSIFWVTISKVSKMQAQRVYQLQTDLAQQMKMDLSNYRRAGMLLKGLKKLHSFLIIIDGLCESLPLITVGIPEPNRENRSKILLIASDYNICHIMKSDKIIKVDTLSLIEKWDLFTSKAGDMVLAPAIRPLARQLVELCPGRPPLINAVSQSLRDEANIEVWRNSLPHLFGFDMVFRLLEICYECLKDDMVQKCFLYCALFPNDYFFKPEEVIRYWIDECFIHGDANIATKIDVGCRIMRKLLGAKMLESSIKHEDDCLKMVDMWRKWATTAMEREPYSYLKSMGNSRHVKKVYEEVEQLREVSIFAADIFSSKSVMQCPMRPQLLDKIWEYLMDPNVRITSIYGGRGVGKTTAMTKIRKQLVVSSDTFDSIICVTFSESKTSRFYQLQTDIALQINLDLPEDGRAARLLEGLEKVENFIIIIDDVEEPFSFTEVGIPELTRENHHKIVLISRDIEVCYLMRSDKIIKVDTFSLTEKWDLFVSKAGNMFLTPDIRSLARQLVELCPGRPLIINAISHAMRDEVDIQVWRDTLTYLMGFEAEVMVFELLKICYKYLKDDIAQRCFLYCALFPNDYLFNPEGLIRYWLAESLIHGDADIVTKRDEAFKVMTKLLDASMLEMSENSEDNWLKMPDLCRDFAIRIMKQEVGLEVHSGLGLEKLPFNPKMGVAGKVSLMRNEIEVLEILPAPYSNVSTLLFHENPISQIHPSFFTLMPGLQFLDLSYTWITKLPSSISDLTQLRALFLHYCSNLENIPSLQKLTNLQVLSLSGTSIAELPHGMEDLISLRSLDLSDTPKLWHIRVGMLSALSHLEELRLQGSGLCKVDSPMVANYLLEMRCLKHLSILMISTVCYGDLLDTIMCLQEHNLKIFSVNVYGTTQDYNEDM